jgi:hypothetical protein
VRHNKEVKPKGKIRRNLLPIGPRKTGAPREERQQKAETSGKEVMVRRKRGTELWDHALVKIHGCYPRLSMWEGGLAS